MPRNKRKIELGGEGESLAEEEFIQVSPVKAVSEETLKDRSNSTALAVPKKTKHKEIEVGDEYGDDAIENAIQNDLKEQHVAERMIAYWCLFGGDGLTVEQHALNALTPSPYISDGDTPKTPVDAEDGHAMYWANKRQEYKCWCRMCLCASCEGCCNRMTQIGCCHFVIFILFPIIWPFSALMWLFSRLVSCGNYNPDYRTCMVITGIPIMYLIYGVPGIILSLINFVGWCMAHICCCCCGGMYGGKGSALDRNH